MPRSGVPRPSQVPLLVYDGDCGVCAWWTNRARSRTGSVVRYAPYQAVAAEFPHIPIDAFQRSVHLLIPGNPPLSGAAAVYRLLRHTRFPWTLLWPVYRSVPPFAWLSSLAYTVAARNRATLSRLSRCL